MSRQDKVSAVLTLGNERPTFPFVLAKYDAKPMKDAHPFMIITLSVFS
jgi:hypothetical protein